MGCTMLSHGCSHGEIFGVTSAMVSRICSFNLQEMELQKWPIDPIAELKFKFKLNLINYIYLKSTKMPSIEKRGVLFGKIVSPIMQTFSVFFLVYVCELLY